VKAIAFAARSVIAVFVVGATVLSACAHADSPSHIPRIGVIVPLDSPLEEGMKRELQQLGYIDGKTIVIDWRRSAEAGSIEALRPVAAELVRSKVDLIIAPGSIATRAVLDATNTIPVVFSSGNPVAAGFAASLSRPGGNATGVSVLSLDLYTKCLQFLHEIVPRAQRIAYVRNLGSPLKASSDEQMQAAASTLGVQLLTLDARTVAGLEAALRTIGHSSVDGVLVSGELFFLSRRREIAASLRRYKLAACFPHREYHDEGILLS
jgi:putative ABC transport system substrate-binding protein